MLIYFTKALKPAMISGMAYDRAILEPTAVSAAKAAADSGKESHDYSRGLPI
jgi:hypothetical protein